MPQDLPRRIGLPGLGLKIKEARKAVGWSQERLAEELGVSWMTVHRWEHELRTVSRDKLGALALATERPLTWFLTADFDEANIPGRVHQIVARLPRRFQLVVLRSVDAMATEWEAGGRRKKIP